MNIDIDPKLRKEVEAILQQKGIKPADAIKAFYEEIKKQKGMPIFRDAGDIETIEYILSSPENIKKFIESEEDIKKGNLVSVEWNEKLDRFVEKKAG